MSLLNMAAAIRSPQAMSPQQALAFGDGLRRIQDRKQEEATYGLGGAKRFSAMIGKAADWADTPEKWAQAQQYLTQRGIPDVERFGFEQRDMIRSFYGRPPAERTALEQHMMTVQKMVDVGSLTPEQGKQAVLVKLGVTSPQKKRQIVTGADGFQYYADTQERVLPSVDKPADDKTFVVTGDTAASYGLDQDGSYNVTVGPSGVKAQRIGGGGQTINVGGGDRTWGKPPTDHVWLRDGDGQVITEATQDGRGMRPVAVPVAGGKTATEAETVRAKQAEADRNQQISNTTVMRSINESISALDGAVPVTGLIGVGMSYLPGTPQADHQVRIGQITDSAALAEIARMRKTSPTGGAVGSLTDGERAALGQAASGIARAQSEESQRAALIHYRNVLLAYANSEWGVTEDGRLIGNLPTAPQPGQPASGNSFVVDGVTVTRK